MSSYVCRQHLEPVTSRGTGCPQCEYDKQHKTSRTRDHIQRDEQFLRRNGNHR